MRRILLLSSTMAVIAAAAGGALAVPGDAGPEVREGLAEVRKATAEYREVENALAAGYQPAEHCVAMSELGGMGYHYVDPTAVADPAVDPLRPEVLLYAPKNNGTLKLVAVEYLAVDEDENLATDADRPDLFGIPFNGPMEGHEPGMPVHYDLHAWIFKTNPEGVFADFNPKVSC